MNILALDQLQRDFLLTSQELKLSYPGIEYMEKIIELILLKAILIFWNSRNQISKKYLKVDQKLLLLQNIEFLEVQEQYVCKR